MLDGAARTTTVGDGAVHGGGGRLRARRGRADRRHAAPRASGRRRAVVATGGDRALGLRGRRADPRPGGGRGSGRPAAGRRAGRRSARRPRAADRVGRHRERTRRRAGRGAADRADRPGGPGVVASAAPRAAPGRRRIGLRRGAHRPRPRSCRPRWPRPVKRVRAVLAAAARSHRGHHDPRYTLWQAWERSGLQRRWLAAAERGGTDGALAERNLAAVTALFDIAEDYVTRTAGASLPGLLDHVGGAAAAAGRRRRRPAGETVAVLSPHAALGRDWEMVVIAGLQDGLWPNTTPRGGVLGTQRLLDVLDGLGDGRLGARAAAGRGTPAADRRDGPGPAAAADHRGRQRRRRRGRAAVAVRRRTRPIGHRRRPAEPSPPVPAPPVLSPAAVVGPAARGGLRPAGAVDESERACAAAQLARLAAAGVPGADPAQWHGLGRGEHRRAAVERRRAHRHAEPVDAADPDRLPAALAGRTPRRHRAARS